MHVDCEAALALGESGFKVAKVERAQVERAEVERAEERQERKGVSLKTAGTRGLLLRSPGGGRGCPVPEGRWELGCH